MTRIIYVAVLILNIFFCNVVWSAQQAPFKLGVNRFAWYASLQTINFMPLASADPFSGVIITDWYQVNDNEKYKVIVYILEENLTSNTVSVKVFRQIKSSGLWLDNPVNVAVSSKIEESILNLARQLRIQYALRNK